MTVIQEQFLTSTGGPASGAVKFSPTGFRADDEGSGVIVPCPVVYQLENGVLNTDEMEPGAYTVVIKLDCRGCFDATWSIIVPASVAPVELLPLRV